MSESITIEILPALVDNYIYILRDVASGQTAAVDPSETKPVLDFLARKKWSLDFILNTHHHWDHTGGNLELQKVTGCKVVGSKRDAARIPGIDFQLEDNEKLFLGSSPFEAMEVPGHTTGAIAFYSDRDKILFTGDTLFSLGCGRLFEGTPEQMHASLARIKQLPRETRIYCGHEYTEKNCRFALSIKPTSTELLDFQRTLAELRSRNLPSLPTTLERELRLNPFLKADPIEFAKLRGKRDTFI